jgi:Endoribonuclease GhoS
MARFTVRVELHSASYSDYETLHNAMERRGFSRRITSGDGKVYHLPTAEYDRGGLLTSQEVLDAAKAAAVETGKNYAVLVTEAVSRSWVGLGEVVPKPQFAHFR